MGLLECVGVAVLFVMLLMQSIYSQFDSRSSKEEDIFSYLRAPNSVGGFHTKHTLLLPLTLSLGLLSVSE